MRSIKLIACILLITSTGCGMVVGTTGYWEQYNQSLREANTEQHPGDSDITAKVAGK